MGYSAVPPLHPFGAEGKIDYVELAAALAAQIPSIIPVPVAEGGTGAANAAAARANLGVASAADLSGHVATRHSYEDVSAQANGVLTTFVTAAAFDTANVELCLNGQLVPPGASFAVVDSTHFTILPAPLTGEEVIIVSR